MLLSLFFWKSPELMFWIATKLWGSICKQTWNLQTDAFFLPSVWMFSSFVIRKKGQVCTRLYFIRPTCTRVWKRKLHENKKQSGWSQNPVSRVGSPNFCEVLLIPFPWNSTNSWTIFSWADWAAICSWVNIWLAPAIPISPPLWTRSVTPLRFVKRLRKKWPLEEVSGYLPPPIWRWTDPEPSKLFDGWIDKITRVRPWLLILFLFFCWCLESMKPLQS